MIHKCKKCKKKFKAKSKKRKYCSLDCMYSARKKTAKKPCEVCGKEIIKTPYKIKKTKYCSIKCRCEGTKKRVKTTCDGCGVQMELTVSRFNQNTGTYCTHDCYSKSNRDRLYRNCKNCQKEFWVTISDANKETPRGKYCSRECFYKGNNLYPKTLKLRILVKQKQGRDDLGDRYVKGVINGTTGLKFEDIPKELIELKRLNIKRKRKIKEITHGNSQ